MKEMKQQVFGRRREPTEGGALQCRGRGRETVGRVSTGLPALQGEQNKRSHPRREGKAQGGPHMQAAPGSWGCRNKLPHTRGPQTTDMGVPIVAREVKNLTCL